MSVITNSGVPAEEVRCILYKRVSQFAKEVHVTFSTPTFCSRFLNSTSLAVNEKILFQSFYRPTAQLLSLVFLMRLLNLLMRPL